MNNKQFYILKSVSTLLLLSVFLNCCSNKEATIDDSNSLGTPVHISNPEIADLTEYLDLNANVVFQNKQIVRSTFPGFIEKIYRNIGDEIKTGDELFKVRTKESMAYDSLELDINSKKYEGTVIFKASVNGALTQLNFNSGDFVSEGDEIAVISNPSSMRIILNVPYQYVSSVKSGNDCLIILPDGRKIKASVQKIIPSVDPVAQTQTFIIKLSGNQSLPENLNVIARLTISQAKDALTLPVAAVLGNETLENFWVMKLIDDTTAVRINVQKGIENDSLVQILNTSLNISDRIISQGGFGLPDTAKVTLSK